MKSRLSLVLFLVLIIPVAKAGFARAVPAIARKIAQPGGNSAQSAAGHEGAKPVRPGLCNAAHPALANTSGVKAVPPKAVSPMMFGNAVNLMKAGKYAGSLSEFDSVLRAFPFMKDYVLYFEAEIYGQLKDPARSVQCLERLIREAPGSPLAMRARMLIIQKTLDKKTLVRLLADFTERYPGHGDLSLRLAGLLNEEGKAAQARKILEGLYTGAGSESQAALAELGRRPTPKERLLRAANLLKLDEAKEAERELLALPDDAGHRQDKLDLLGQALFDQKRYAEAASVYSAAADTYQAARAYARSSDIDDLTKAIGTLSRANDPEAPYLQLALASIERRNGDWNGALLELEKTGARYPGVAEEARWQTAWLYYMKRDYRDALGLLSSLAGRYERPRFYYWMAKSLEAIGGAENEKAAMGIYERLAGGHEDYYAVLAALRTGVALRGPGPAPAACTGLPAERIAFRRFDMLMQAGLGQEAAGDLLYSSRQLTDPGALIEIARELDRAGAFRSAIAVALKVPDEMRPKDVMYPKAFWRKVRKECSPSGLDPYLVLSVIREESSYDPRACSPAGAMGLMQLEPGTAKKYCRLLNITIDGNEDIYRVGSNLALGSYYLKKLYGEFKAIEPALAAYNAGPDIVRKWLSSGNYRGLDEFVEDIPYGETKNYVKRIITSYYKYGGWGGATPPLAGRLVSGPPGKSHASMGPAGRAGRPGALKRAAP